MRSSADSLIVTNHAPSPIRPLPPPGLNSPPPHRASLSQAAQESKDREGGGGVARTWGGSLDIGGTLSKIYCNAEILSYKLKSIIIKNIYLCKSRPTKVLASKCTKTLKVKVLIMWNVISNCQNGGYNNLLKIV